MASACFRCSAFAGSFAIASWRARVLASASSRSSSWRAECSASRRAARSAKREDRGFDGVGASVGEVRSFFIWGDGEAVGGLEGRLRGLDAVADIDSLVERSAGEFGMMSWFKAVSGAGGCLAGESTGKGRSSLT